MAETTTKSSSPIDPNSGFCAETKIFKSLRPHAPLPPEKLPLSVADYAVSLLQRSICSLSLSTTTALICASTGLRLSYSDFLRRTETLSASLQVQIGLSRGDTVFVLSPTCLQIPILYFSLLSLGIVVSPANPISTESEISRQIDLAKPVIVFATSATAHKLPISLRHRTILIDSSDFHSMMTANTTHRRPVAVEQSDTAAILYSSGTTGPVKGVVLTHRNFIAALSEWRANEPAETEEKKPPHAVTLITMPLFHSFGFAICLKSVALAETVVLMERFDLEGMLKAVEAFRVSSMSASPPIVVALTKVELVEKYDLSSLRTLGCGGAPLGKEVSERFSARFPKVELRQGYGLTESAIAPARMSGPDEVIKYGSVGRLIQHVEAKVVDTVTGVALSPGQRGELWFRGLGIMKGYVGDEEATASALDKYEGWLKTGDLCYIDGDGFVYIVDRLKELIKYKAYQVPPAELEHLLHSHPEIADSAVIPYPDEEVGEIPMAFLVRKAGSNLNEEQVMDFIAKQVAPYKKLRRVAFIHSIPKSPAGKILRRELIGYALSAPSPKL